MRVRRFSLPNAAGTRRRLLVHVTGDTIALSPRLILGETPIEQVGSAPRAVPGGLP